MRAQWDPQQYLRHADHRARPFHDLLARVPEPPDLAPPSSGLRHRITDLGCGTADTTTVHLLERWPDALVTGVDSSDEMLRRAAGVAGPVHGRGKGRRGRLDLELADIVEWQPAHHQQLIISNAALHWLPDHAEHFPRWVDRLTPGGTLAFQVPANYDSPQRLLLAETIDQPRWREKLAGLGEFNREVLAPAEYLHRLMALGCEVDAWETVYQHVLTGEDAVLDWVRGTALRPVLSALHDDADRTAFLAEYGARLRPAFPSVDGRTVLPFRRVFVVATKSATANTTASSAKEG
ncbi:hypothetical protein BIV57_03780 [Mangrovactinospora gilvigrisea]|uniref:Trans-aconitate 2-methyltransferase n=1 Tax=Mangrovactinospora gilvigrisea TaxID=1428644 RepID=A0A1J7BZF8_9ACTN|nr:methyltransferase domain-containing protein [Mangrovactinospora gilvigrisea]OIV38865.1 hypothetical protein BIV57_03780 [Mangrovactinospora gilvigrisea]